MLDTLSNYTILSTEMRHLAFIAQRLFLTGEMVVFYNVLLERALATVFADRYEHWKNPGLTLLLMVCWWTAVVGAVWVGMCIFRFPLQIYKFACHLDQPELTLTLVTNQVLVSASHEQETSRTVDAGHGVVEPA